MSEQSAINNVISRIIKSAQTLLKDWVTINGTHVEFDESGNVISGPTGIQNYYNSDSDSASSGLRSQSEAESLLKDIAQTVADAGGDSFQDLNSKLFSKLGYDGKPQVVSQSEFDETESDNPTLYRAFKREEHMDEFVEGELVIGNGFTGSGTNTAISEKESSKYGDYIVEMKLSSDAKVITESELMSTFQSIENEMWDEGGGIAEYASWLASDTGCVAAALGYDAIKGDHNGWYNVLNRSKLVINGDKDIKKMICNSQKFILKSLLSRMTRNAQEIVKREENQCKNLHTDGIIKEWDESLHPRDEHGRFASAFGGTSIPDFANAVVEAKAGQNPGSAWRVTAHDEEDLRKHYSDAQFHITSGGSTVAVASDGDIVSVCKCRSDQMSGTEVMQLAIQNGGVKLDSYDGNHGFYLNCGFEPVSWCRWDDSGADDGWINQDWLKVNGLKSDITTAELSKISDSSLKVPREDVIFYKYTGSQTHYKRSEAITHLENFKNTTQPSQNYDAAQEKRDKEV